jgi:hypothetical protein
VSVKAPDPHEYLKRIADIVERPPAIEIETPQVQPELVGLGEDMPDCDASDTAQFHVVMRPSGNTERWRIPLEMVKEGEAIPWYGMEWQVIDHGADYADKGHRCQHETIARAIKRKPPGETW